MAASAWIFRSVMPRFGMSSRVGESLEKSKYLLGHVDMYIPRRPIVRQQSVVSRTGQGWQRTCTGWLVGWICVTRGSSFTTITTTKPVEDAASYGSSPSPEVIVMVLLTFPDTLITIPRYDRSRQLLDIEVLSRVPQSLFGVSFQRFPHQALPTIYSHNV